jgi:hypothetical protein
MGKYINVHIFTKIGGSMANEMYLLWWDEQIGTAEEKIGRAANYYANRTGRHPTVARVDLGMIKEEKVIHGMKVTPDRQVLRNMIWLGEEDRNGQ